MKTFLWAAALIALAAGAAPAQTPPEARWLTASSDRNPTVSPGGDKVMFQSNRSGRGALYVRGSEGGPVTLFLDSGDNPTYPDWSPDGRRIVYVAEVDGQEELFVVNADGTGRRRVTDHPAREGHPHWSADGQRIFFNSARPTPDLSVDEDEHLIDIYSIRADGSDLRRHTDCGGECSYPTPSPDGRRFVYRKVVREPGLTGAMAAAPINSEVVVVDLATGVETNLTGHPAYDVYPTWSADGRFVYFSSNRAGPPGTLHLWRVPAAGGAAERLSSGPWSHRQAVASRDGRKIYAFTYQRHGGADVGFIGVFDVPPG